MIDYSSSKDVTKTVSVNGEDVEIGISQIYINAGGIQKVYSGISRDSMLGINEIVWGGELTRSTGSFEFGNIDTVDFGIVKRCEISFKYMHYEDYITLCNQVKQRTMTVTFFNRDSGEFETCEMAMTNQERGKLYNYGNNKYIGNLDIGIKLVATNRDIEGTDGNPYRLTYNINGGEIISGQTSPVKFDSDGTYSKDVYQFDCEELLDLKGVYQNEEGKQFIGWSESSTASFPSYLPSDIKTFTVYGDTTLYAVYNEFEDNTGLYIKADSLEELETLENIEDGTIGIIN